MSRRLALVGYGKMGKLIAQLAPEYDFEVVQRLNSVESKFFNGRDVAIELFFGR